MKVRELPDTPRTGVCLYCSECGQTYSATRGDYFTRAPEDVLLCCDEPLTLVRKVISYQPVGRAQAS